MITDEDVRTIMGYAVNECVKQLEAAMASMDDNDRSYMCGYIAGYSDGVIHCQQAQQDSKKPA